AQEIDALGGANPRRPSLQPGLASTVAAKVIAKQLRSNEPTEVAKHAVFLVHGHHVEALAVVERFLHSINVRPIVLTRMEGGDQSLMQRFFRVGSEATFAIAILSADDYGSSRRQYDEPGVETKALQFRARQNVILELGFFYGRLGWEKVFVLII